MEENKAEKEKKEKRIKERKKEKKGWKKKNEGNTYLRGPFLTNTFGKMKWLYLQKILLRAEELVDRIITASTIW